MANSKKYWKGLEQLNNDPQFLESSKNEFPESLPVDEFLGDKKTLEDSTTTRRDFLKFLGFGVASASLAACETPVTKAIPYINKPEEITPGVASYYASTYYDGHDYAPILVKTREGRPIFIKGNTLSSLTKGEINARVNASVLSLYDGNRIKSPMIDGESVDWPSIDNRLGKELKNAKNIRILCSSIVSPSTKALMENFLNEKENSIEGEIPSEKNKVVYYDTISYSGILEANEVSFGKSVLPTYSFDKARVIVSIGADFLSGWLDALQYNVGYAEKRNPDNSWMSKHYQFEANMSLTGTNADVRQPVKPSEYGTVLAAIYNHVATELGADKIKASVLKKDYENKVKSAVKSLLANRGESIVVCGSNDKNIQLIVNGLNNMLGNYGKTINIEKASYTRQAKDQNIIDLIQEMKSGKVDALMIYGVDPIFTLGDKFRNALSKVKTTVSFATKMNETASVCKYVCPDNHYLESWNDANPVSGYYSLIQPSISPLFDTRQFQESILKWSGINISYYDYIKEFWKTTIFPSSEAVLFQDFWNKSLHDGIVEISNNQSEGLTFSADVMTASIAVSKIKEKQTELTLYLKEGVGDGIGADNPVLQELPDPVSKITWDNYVTMNPSEMKEQGLNTVLGQESPANLLSVLVNGVSLELPVVAQPGQARGTIGIALGYGKKVGNMSEPTGKNVYPFVSTDKNGNVSYFNDATLSPVAGTYPIAATQTHQTVMGRDSVVRETTISTYKKGKKSDYNPEHALAAHEDGKAVKKNIKEFDLWGAHPVENVGHRWGMSIDMNLCTGCGACITACNLENNVPVVGKDEVRRGREMHWMRIDRYYSTDADTEDKTIAGYRKMENASTDNPQVVHQPMMCQHCNHAGCETVCPVAATTHSNEGLNMMTYNRCIGTRYCANNCAYKVRRFNWFNYTSYHKFSDINPSQDDLGRMILNPDVVVRTRGVMEKCSFCIQGIQAAKLQAKKEGRPVKDGDVDCACSSACGSGAIKFGDLNDKNSEVRAGMEHDRAYRVIEEVGQDPNVYYQTKVRNIEEQEA